MKKTQDERIAAETARVVSEMMSDIFGQKAKKGERKDAKVRGRRGDCL